MLHITLLATQGWKQTITHTFAHAFSEAIGSWFAMPLGKASID